MHCARASFERLGSWETWECRTRQHSNIGECSSHSGRDVWRLSRDKASQGLKKDDNGEGK